MAVEAAPLTEVPCRNNTYAERRRQPDRLDQLLNFPKIHHRPLIT
jgi:hypothetical protein